MLLLHLVSLLYNRETGLPVFVFQIREYGSLPEGTVIPKYGPLHGAGIAGTGSWTDSRYTGGRLDGSFPEWLCLARRSKEGV